MITIEPLGGLANRMRVIASGIWLKEELDTDLKVIWNKNNELNCPYHLLFEKTDAFEIISKNPVYRFLKRSNGATAAGKKKANIYNALLGVNYCIAEPDFPGIALNDNFELLQIAKKYKHVYIQTCQEFGNNQAAFNHLKPILPLREKIENLSHKFDEFTIGVHIRRTDHKQLFYRHICQIIHPPWFRHQCKGRM